MLAVNPNHMVQNAPARAPVGMPRFAPANIEEQLIHVTGVSHGTEAHPHVDITALAKIGVKKANLVEGRLSDHAEACNRTGQTGQHELSPLSAFSDFRIATHEKRMGQRVHDIVAALAAGMNERYVRVAVHDAGHPLGETRQITIVIVADLDVITAGDP